MVAFSSGKSTRILAGVEFRRISVDEASQQGAKLLPTHGLAGFARGDGPEIAWALPRDPKGGPECWVCWTHDSRDWYTAFVACPEFLATWRAMVDEVAK